MAAGYSVFANGGYRVVPYFIGKIQAADGKVLYQANPPTVVETLAEQPAAVQNTTATSAAPRVIEADVAYMMATTMQDVIKSGTGYAARVLQRNDIAGKTGTTNRQMDAWFSGFNPRVETTVWVGYDQPKPLSEYGGQAALPIWIDFMRVALNGQPEVTLRQPDNVVAARIDPDTGLLASPEQTNAVFEVFREGTVPTEDAPNAPEDASAPPSNNDGAQLF
jgi:penicillin-binding protein 1A